MVCGVPNDDFHTSEGSGCLGCNHAPLICVGLRSWTAGSIAHFRAVIETGLFVSPIYWLCNLRKDFGIFMLFWLAAYLLNLVSSVFFKICAMGAASMGPAALRASFVQVFKGTQTMPKGFSDNWGRACLCTIHIRSGG